jgi:hypothetical protein
MMQRLRKLSTKLGDERGVTLALLALGGAVLIGMAAIAIDLGMLMTAKTQGQRVADAAAHAGAVRLAQLAKAPKAEREAEAREAARETAARNDILGQNYDAAYMQDGDITFPEDHKVRAVVYRNRSRDNPLGTFFASILGINEVDMAVDATAAVFIGGAAECSLPIALPDRWTESVGNPDWPTLDDTFDPDDTEDEGTDDYIAWQGGDGGFHTGYDDDSYGFQVKLRTTGGGGGEFNPSWYGVWRHPDDSGSGFESGTNEYRKAITGEGCQDNDRIVHRDQEVDTEPGNFGTPTRKAFEDLIEQDPDARWEPGEPENPGGCACVVDASGDPVTDSPRIRPLPLFDPTEIPDPGNKPFTITNFMSIFVEDVDENGYVVGRLLGLTGFESTGIPGIGEDTPGIKAVQIIE